MYINIYIGHGKAEIICIYIYMCTHTHIHTLTCNAMELQMSRRKHLSSGYRNMGICVDENATVLICALLSILP